MFVVLRSCFCPGNSLLGLLLGWLAAVQKGRTSGKATAGRQIHVGKGRSCLCSHMDSHPALLCLMRGRDRKLQTLACPLHL